MDATCLSRMLVKDQYLGDVGSYVELIGNVLDSNVLKLLTCINLSQELGKLTPIPFSNRVTKFT
jgi:hypothetical protein